MSREGDRKLAERVLSDPDLYPDEFKAAVPRILKSDPTFRITTAQLPPLETTHYIGADGEPVFQNSWVNHGGGYESAGFYRDSVGRVHLCGLVKNGVAGTTIFSLPAGYRPKARELFLVDANGAVGRVDITSVGDVIHILGSSVYFQLSGISFRAFS